MIRNAYTKNTCTTAEYLFSRALFVIGILVLAVTLIGMMLTSCSKAPDRKKECERMAVESMRLLLDNPETLKVIGVSDIDSVFGRQFFSNEELANIVENLTVFNENTWGNEKVDFDDPAFNAKMERAMSASDLLRNVIEADMGDGEWSGWKMRVRYSARDKTDTEYESERYVIFDKDLKYIIHSFEIPVL